MVPPNEQNDSRGRIDDADFSGSRLHAADFSKTRVTDALLVGTDLSGEVDGLRVNGVDVTAFVEFELDRQFPQRVQLRAIQPDGISAAWEIVTEDWRTTVARARALPEPLCHERVDGDWSFVETLRHLIMATDCWLSRAVHGETRPYHPWGLAGSFLTDPASLGLDPSATPTLDEVLAVRRSRVAAVGAVIAGLTTTELARVCVPPNTPGHPTGPHTVLHCLHVILNEEWEHARYANRDLSALEARLGAGA